MARQAVRKKTERPVGVFPRLAALYDRMQSDYDRVAQSADFNCFGCTKNCCTSYFQHHTYVEWAYMWKGIEALPIKKKEAYLQRAADYVEQSKRQLAAGVRPDSMCPLNDEGLCGLYTHRLMICRLHGVPHFLLRGIGQASDYPGCFRFDEKDIGNTPRLDRTPLYRELAMLERDYLGRAFGKAPKVDLTLAEMMVRGKPSFDL